VRAAVLGIGAIGSYIVDGIRWGDGGAVEVVGLADVPARESRLAELAADLGSAYRTDPLRLLEHNVHEVQTRGAFGEMALRLSNLPSPANPTSSLLAALSPLAALRRLTDQIQVG
jgi:predicted dinucleotide-utilizing enzyme